MTATNHALTGAAIASLIEQPLLAIPLAYLSHFICDALPHFDVKFSFGSKQMYQYLSGEAIAMAALLVFLLSQGVTSPWYLAVCAVAAMSPDLAWLYYGVRGQHTQLQNYGWISRLHHKIQWSATKLGIVPELIWAGGAVAVILSQN